MVTISGVTREQVTEALKETNIKFKGNIKFNRLDQTGRRLLVTLTVNNSRGPGSRLGFSGRHVCAACWHVYGVFFDAVFHQAPDAVIRATGNQKITREHGNWIDKEIGSIMCPLKYSDACECGSTGLAEELEIG